MIFGQLGEIELKPPLVPTRFTRAYGWGYAEKDRVSGKSGLQQTPDALFDITMEFYAHYLEPVNRPQSENEKLLTPREYLQLFINAADSKEALPLVVGREAMGNYVITDIPVRLELFTPDGELLEVRWEVKLLEFADQPVESRQKIQGFLKRIRS